MMAPLIDVPVIEKHLEDIRESLLVLARFQKLSFQEFEKDQVRQWAVEKGLERCIQNVLDIGAHILASLGSPVPEEYREIIIRLGKQGVIPVEFAAKITPMAGLRNALIYEYLEIDLRKVFTMLQNNLDDFGRFAAYIVTFRNGVTTMPGEIDVKGVLDSMVERIVARFHPEKIILFGSYARGEATCDSDLDLLIVMNLRGSRRQTANEIDLLLADRMVPLDLIILTPEELERQSGLIGTIAHEAAREGVVIYERAA